MLLGTTSFRRSPVGVRLAAQYARFLRPRVGTLRHHAPRPVEVPAAYYRQPAVSLWPRISVVTPTLNSARFLERTIVSVVGQEYHDLELIVQDGGSTDSTHEIIARHRHELARFESTPDHGQSDALNRGFRAATGDVLAYLNADDLLLPGALDYVAWFFGAHPDIDVVYGHRVLIDDNDFEIGRWVLPRHDSRVLSWADYVPQETLFWRRRAWDAVDARFDETFHFAMDWDLLVRFRDAGAQFARAPRFLGAFRVHPAQKSTAQMAPVGAGEMARIRERIHGRPIARREVARHVRGYLLRHMTYQTLYRLGVLRY